ncbi:MAG: hypothetical protein Q4G40_03995 [Brachybacterium sp.]|nr:hypothetical protein [Brachybacterium sp.]
MMGIKSKASILISFGVVAGIAVTPAFAGDDSQVTVEDLVPVLAEEQEIADQSLDPSDLTGLVELEPETIRSLGEFEGSKYWVGTDEGSNICLIQEVGGETDFVAATCGDYADFNLRGLSLMAFSGDDDSEVPEAHLLPDDVEPPRDGGVIGDESAEPLPESALSESESLDSNLIFIVPESGKPVEPELLDREHGSDFKLQPLEREEEQ